MTTKKEPLPKTIRKWEKPIPFTETFKWEDLDATFTADSFTKWVHDALPITKIMPSVHHTKAREKGTKIGRWIFYMRPLPIWHYASPFMFSSRLCPTRGTLSVYRGTNEREICFDKKVDIPVLATESMLSPIMSLTPNEVFTLRGQIRRAKADTAIAGLGLGWVARKVLQRNQVKHLTIYEKDQNLIDFFGASLTKDFGDRLTIVCCDAYEAPWHNHDVALWDIWEGFGHAADDYKYLKIRDALRQNGKVCVGWGEGIYRD